MDLLHRWPERSTAIVIPERELHISYGALRQQVAAAADAFVGAGVLPGQRIAMALPNGLEMIVCVLGASLAGTAAPLNPGLHREEFAFYLADAAAALLIVRSGGADDARRAAADLGVPTMTAGVSGEGT